MGNIFDKIKKATLFVVGRFQKILLAMLLFLTYTLLVGAMLALISIFGRKLLWPARKNDSYWVKAEGYEPDLKESLRQS